MDDAVDGRLAAMKALFSWHPASTGCSADCRRRRGRRQRRGYREKPAASAASACARKAGIAETGTAMSCLMLMPSIFLRFGNILAQGPQFGSLGFRLGDHRVQYVPLPQAGHVTQYSTA
jgi:hypothetical protein